MSEKNKIKLPRGEGSISIRDNGTYMYRKRIGNPKKEYTVYGANAIEVMEKMRELEAQVKDGQCREMVKKETVTLYQAMLEWLELYKRGDIKDTSYDTLEKTIRLYIGDYDIGHVRLSAVDGDMIQRHLRKLDAKEYSFSTIKKCHDALGAFFNYASKANKIRYNPMDVVVLMKSEKIKKKTKEIQFMEKEDIKKFVDEATEVLDNAYEKYTFGFCLAANIYLGMRAGELLALKWKDVDFQNDTIWVHENLQMVRVRDLNQDDDSNHKERNYKYVSQSVKNHQNRNIHMNSKAKEILLRHRQLTKYCNEDDYVCATKKGKHASISYLSDDIESIQKCAKTQLRAKGTHVIRHTCASLYFRAGVRIELIAALLGHSVDVCQKTYLHFVDEQKREAVRLITDYDQVDL